MLTYARAIYDDNEINAVVRSLKSGWLSGGAETHLFEMEFADFMGVKHALSVNSGSVADLVALQALGLKRGDEVITNAGCAFPTTISSMVYLGLIPVFVDIKGLCIDPDLIEKAISKKTKAIMFAHTLGFTPSMNKLMKIVRKHKLKLVEDCCFPAKTKIKIKGGYKNIEDIKKGDLVLTRKGYKKVLKSWKTGNKNIIENFGIVATPDHPIITKNGVKRLDKLTASDIIYIWNEKQSSIMEKNITDTHNLSCDKEGCIFIDIVRLSLFHFIGKFGLIILEKYLRVKLFTIKTIIHLITTLQTLNVLHKKNILKDILLRKENSLLEKILKLPDKKPQNGTGQNRELSFTKELQNYLGKIKKSIKKYVKFAGKNIRHTIQKGQCIVEGNVSQKVDVYNLNIEDCHEFFADNVLVHNCDAVGSTYNDQKVGTFGDVATVSFFPAHHMTTGEGGMVLTNNSKIFREALSIRDWGRDCVCGYLESCKNRYNNPPFDHRYYYTRIGLNFKMSEMQSAFGREQLKRLPGFIKKRKENYKLMADQLGQSYNMEVSPFAYPLFSKKKEKVMQSLNNAGIDTRTMFAGDIRMHPAFKNIRCRVVGEMTGTKKVMKEGFFVGIAPHLSEEDILFISKEIKKCLI